MGIRQFKSRLEPYAERGFLEEENIIVDGPALAYHILNLCSRQTRKTSPFEQPSYASLGKTAVDWLTQIQICQLSISAIYFDGYLPSSKRPERVQRLTKSTSELVRYHASFSQGVPSGSSRPRADDAVIELFPDAWPGETKAKPPPPPFLVPAIIDALRTSPAFGARVQLVPGEADGFCARHAREHGGIVLTSDSDLLVYDLGNAGGVVFFADIDADPETQRLVARQYRPADLCRRLSIKPETGLQYLAFEINRDPYVPFQQVVERVRRCEAVSAFEEEYSAFIKHYLLPEVGAHLKIPQDLALDPRISELVLRSLQSTVADSEPAVNSRLEMYLPVLLDSPTRTSAWEASKGLRQIGYGILQSTGSTRIPSVHEIRRMQTASSGTQVDVPTLDDADKLAASLFALISTITAAVGKDETRWVVLSVYQDISMTVERARGYPLGLELLGQQARGSLDECSWGFLHFLAQIQATYYSLRMVSQILEVSVHHGATLSAVMAELARILSDLPPLPGFPSPRDFSETLRKVGEPAGLSCLVDISEEYEDIVPHIQAIGKPLKKTKATRKRKLSPSASGRVKPRSSNQFDVLGMGEEQYSFTCQE